MRRIPPFRVAASGPSLRGSSYAASVHRSRYLEDQESARQLKRGHLSHRQAFVTAEATLLLAPSARRCRRAHMIVNDPTGISIGSLPRASL
jgi:hypothetical protein